jgi:hypothetical protein
MLIRFANSFALSCLLVAAGQLSAQQGGLGPPAGAPALGPPPAPVMPAADQAAPAIGPPPAPVGPAGPVGPSPGSAFVVPPYGLPPGAYVPMAPPVIVRDPANPAMWGGVEALLWWTRNQPLPIPLLTTGPGSLGATAGNLGAPGTTSLNEPLSFGATGGVRFFGGVWITGDHTWGLDGSIFALARQSTGFGAFDRSGKGGFVINEPVAGAPFSTQVSAPGFDTGGASVIARSRLVGGDVDVLYNLVRAGGWTVNLLGGYRAIELDESLTIDAGSQMFVATTFTDNAGNILVTAPAGSTITVTDRFAVRNQFNGGQLGIAAQYSLARWYFGGTVKLAIGATHEVVTVDGATNVFPLGGNPVPLIGGNFATLQIGRYAQDRFAVAPEVQLNVGYQVTPWMRATVGYQFLFLSSALRPGSQIDNTYNGVQHPMVPMVSSSYWAQGLNFGLVFSY